MRQLKFVLGLKLFDTTANQKKYVGTFVYEISFLIHNFQVTLYYLLITFAYVHNEK